eukprot:TRINITY_DN65_c0_g1_i2.p1 TRINITY_DN65_c0_g1~~TRINITY_DN65_c0_g1_i2.p1  ORF type:complete len:677 (+),score=166.97 TRINITY_DN65_c0_g1_i2:2178-4208(+)
MTLDCDLITSPIDKVVSTYPGDVNAVKSISTLLGEKDSKVSNTLKSSTGASFDDGATVVEYQYERETQKGIQVKTSSTATVDGGFTGPLTVKYGYSNTERKAGVNIIGKIQVFGTAVEEPGAGAVAVAVDKVRGKRDQLLGSTILRSDQEEGTVDFDGIANSFTVTTSEDPDLYLTQFNYDQVEATSSACSGDCTDPNNGKCSNSLCACFSGFSGNQCEIYTPNGFAPDQVSTGSLYFTPQTTLSALTDKVTVKIVVPSEQSIGNKDTGSYSTTTLLTFPKGDCNYPNSANNWELTTDEVEGTWFDTYENDFSYSDLIACGLKKTTTVLGATTFEVPIEIERNYLVKSGRFEVSRAAQKTIPLQLIFPAVIASSSVTVAAPPNLDLFSTISSIEFDGKDWKVILTTIVASPVELALPKVVPSPFSSSRDFSIKLLPGSPCTYSTTGTNEDCTQKFEITIGDCKEIDLTGTKTLKIDFSADCRSGASGTTCSGSQPAPITIELSTTRSCPIESKFALTAEMAPSLEKNHVYSTSDSMTLNIDFSADIPTALQSRVSVSAVCAYPEGTIVSTCSSIDAKYSLEAKKHYSVYTSDDKHDIVISVDSAGDLKAASGGLSNNFVVQADLLVNYNLIKRSIQNTAHVTKTIVRVADPKADRSGSSAQLFSIALVFLSALLLL